MEKTSFFAKGKVFYTTFFSMFLMVALQNLVAYSVNMADNMMLGHYSQATLTGAATVNQIFFLIQQYALALGNAVIVLATQYWGKGEKEPVRKIAGNALRIGFVTAVILVIICGLFPEWLIRIFTKDAVIIAEGAKYLSIIKWTFILFILTNILMSTLRAIGIVNISFYISVISLILNCGINYTLIFGRFGMPEMGIRGAAVGTLISRIVEFLIVLVYVIKVEKSLRISFKDIVKIDNTFKADYMKILWPIICSTVLWGVSVPMQTAILGHLSSEAIAANSVATTFYQYLKVIILAMSSVSSVMIGQAIGRGKIEEVKAAGRTLSVLDILVGLILAIMLFVLRNPLLTFYNLTPETKQLALDLIVLMCFVMIGMSYQMPVSFGIIQGGGDAKFTMRMNMISTWLIVMPLSFLAAFVWKWPVWLVVLTVQSDQIFKGLPTFIHFRSYKWIKKLTKQNSEG